MFDSLEEGDRYRLIIGALLVALLAFGAGTVVSGGDGGAAVGESVSSDTVKQEVQSFMDQRVAQQQQQLSLIASQRPNITEDELSLEASVTDVSDSNFGSLQRVTVSISGTVPAQTGGTRPVDQEQVFYVSQDGRYLFQQPQDLQQAAVQQQSPTGAQGSQP